MKHRFVNTCYDATKLLDGCNKLSTFMQRLVRQSTSDPDMWDPLVYRGDGFEAFVEVLINLSPIDKRINISNYQPWDVAVNGPDMGVDGVGTSHAGDPHCIQVKFRANTQQSLTANEDHISNFVAKSLSMYPDKNVNMTIFTTADSLMESTNQEMYHGKVKTLGYRQLAKLVDNNTAFWSAFRKEMNI